MLATHSNSGDDLDGSGRRANHSRPSDGHEQGQIAEPHRRLLVVKELDRGGFGTVYLAIRDSGGPRTGGLEGPARGTTLPRCSTDSRENRILVALSHPNIARRIDGGTTEDGRPFFVMEYIDGEPLDQWCDSNRLGLVDRLRVTQTILDTVQEVHNHGMVTVTSNPATF